MNSLESGSNVLSGLEMIMEKSPDTIVLVDRNLTLVKVISAKDDYYHYLANNCIGKQPQALFPDGKNYDQYEIYRAAVKRVFEEQVKVDFSFEVSFEGKNYYYLSQASLFNEELVIVYTRDVSSLKTENNLQELINTILDRLPLGVFVKDGDNHFNYLYWNHFMEEITGIETREIEGHDDFEVNYNALMTAEERLETDMNVIKTGLTARFKGKVKSASGDYRDIEVAKYPISLNNGKPLVLALWRDITSELATENTLRRTRILTKMALRISDIRTCSIFIGISQPSAACTIEISLTRYRSSPLRLKRSWSATRTLTIRSPEGSPRRPASPKPLTRSWRPVETPAGISMSIFS